MLKFFLKYSALAVIFFFLFGYQSLFDIQSIYTDGLNFLAVSLINLTGLEAVQNGININLPTSTLIVLFGCNGLEALLLFWAGVLAYESPKEYKLKWFLQGTLILYIINLFRIVFLARALEYHSEHFDFLHDYITQDIMIFLALLTFLFYVKGAKSYKNEKI